MSDRELKVAEQLIESLATDFDPSRYHDQYKQCVMKMIERKAAGQKIVTGAAEPKRAPAAKDLMAALQASLAEARGGNGRPVSNAKPPAKRRKSA